MNFKDILTGGVSILCAFVPGIQICAYFWDMTIVTYFSLHFKIATPTISNLFTRYKGNKKDFL